MIRISQPCVAAIGSVLTLFAKDERCEYVEIELVDDPVVVWRVVSSPSGRKAEIDESGNVQLVDSFG